MTDGFHDSLWTDQEVGFAFGRGIPIISVKLGKDPYGFIGKLTDKQIENIVKAFNENSQVYDSYGFNGKNPRHYGGGLLCHLQRITNNDYKLSSRNKIERA